MFAFTLSRILGQRVTDPTSGFRLYNRRAIELFARDYPHDYPEVEAVLMLHAHRLRLAEVPVRMHQRGGGRSSITSRCSAYYMIKVSLALLVGLLRRRAWSSPATGARVGRRGDLRCTSAPSSPRSSFAALVFAARVRDGAPPVPARALRDAVARRGARAARARGLDAAAGRDLQAGGHRHTSNAFFVIAFAFLLLLLLHFSAVVSRLADETRVLAQRLALLEQRQRAAGGRATPRATSPTRLGAGAAAARATAGRPKR